MSEPLDGVSIAVSDRYRIERELERGGMATVYLAQDLKHERRVAIKVLRPDLTASLGTERFLREIKLTARLNHPHILPLLDSGETNGLLYYVMPFVEGRSLRDRLVRESQLPVDDALRIVREVTDALEYAHRHDVIHRDIKPANILLDDGHAVVADFGIARAIDVAGDGKLTATGVVVGTPEYMSPEQAAGNEMLDARSDVYAVGCLLYELLAGQPPFTGATTHSVIRQHMIAEPRPITHIRAGVPDAVATALTRALAKAPADRFASARAFGEALTALPPSAPASSTSRRWLARHRALAVAAVLTVLTVVAIAIVLIAMPRRPGPIGAPRVAVLPLRNLSTDSADSYFAQALHENLYSRLAMIPGLAVTSRSSVLRYHPGQTRTSVIAKELGVDFLLEGSVRKDSQRVDVSVRLIDARNDTQLWAQSYPVNLSVASLIDIQADIASQLADALRVRITAAVRGRISDHPTESTAAYQLFLRATQLPFGWDREANHTSEELLKQALALDPRFLEAAVALAQVYFARTYILGQPRSWADSGLALAHAAVKADSTLFEGQHALGRLYLDLGHLKEARATYAKLLELRPSDGQALMLLGWMEFLQGRFPKAVTYLGNARAVDPMNATVVGDMMLIELILGDVERASRWHQAQTRLQDGKGGLGDIRILLARGKSAEALQSVERQLADNPRSFATLSMAARAAIESGKLGRARQYLEEIDRTSHDDWDFWALTYRTSYAYVLSQLGEHARAQALLERTLHDAMHLIDEGEERPGLKREIAAIHAAMGHRDAAYEWFERAIDGGWRHEALEPSPLFLPLRDEPRFKALMARIDADVANAREQIRREKLGPPLPSD